MLFRSDLPSYTSVPSVDTSRAADESTSSEENGSSDAASGGEVSGIPDVSDDEPVSEEISDAPVVTDLPYDPAKLLDLRKEDILPTELDSYFENSVFIGNSLVVHFQNFYYLMRATDKNFLGGAKFFCASAFSARLDLGDKDRYAKYYPRYDGELLHTWEAVAKMKPETVYYNLMGLNELGLHQYSKTANSIISQITLTGFQAYVCGHIRNTSQQARLSGCSGGITNEHENFRWDNLP